MSNPQFTIAVLESQEFYNGITKPISKEIFGNLVSQGWDHELLTHLLIEKFVVFSNEGDTVFELQNSCRDAQFLHVAEHIGFQETESTEVVAEITVSELDPDQILKLWEEDIEITEESTPRGTQYLLERKEIKRHLRVNLTKALLIAAGVDAKFVASLSDGYVDLSDPDASIRIVTRSPDNMIYALGEYVRHRRGPERCAEIIIGEVFDKPEKQDQSNNSVATGIDEFEPDPLCQPINANAASHSVSSSGGEPYFVVTDGANDQALITTDFRDQTYSILSDCGNRAPQVLGLVQQLINLSRKGEEPPSSTFIQLN